MTRKRTTVARLAREAGVDTDDALIALWEDGLLDIATASDALHKQDANRARRALGLATRREVATPEYWEGEFQISRADLDTLLHSLAARCRQPYDGKRLRKKAIHRLQAAGVHASRRPRGR